VRNSSGPDLPVLTLPAGMRATRAVQALLALLPCQPKDGWTEATVEAALQTKGVAVNRVTVYRALDRMVQAGLLYSTVDNQRITRYWVAAATQPEVSTHMECTACHQSIALDAGSATVQAALLALQQALAQSAGVHNAQVDVSVQGECTSCAASSASSL
jgi:Fur family transcriptional regulator, ferric uptake regulator